MTEGRHPRKRQSGADTLTAVDPAELGRVVDRRLSELAELKKSGDPRGLDHDEVAHKIQMGPSTLWDIRQGKGGRGFRPSTLRRLSLALWPPKEYPDLPEDYLDEIFRKPIPRDFSVLKREIAVALEPQFKTIHERLDTLYSRLDITHESHLAVEFDPAHQTEE